MQLVTEIVELGSSNSFPEKVQASNLSFNWIKKIEQKNLNWIFFKLKRNYFFNKYKYVTWGSKPSLLTVPFIYSSILLFCKNKALKSRSPLTEIHTWNLPIFTLTIQWISLNFTKISWTNSMSKEFRKTYKFRGFPHFLK